jgi:spore germination cell wall hydrolase CwlJ-like protein
MLRRVVTLFAVLAAASPLAACGSVGMFGFSRLSSRDCLARVMYFESNRSSTEGMLAVGTVVMNRLGHRGYPNSVCGVVGQHNQFAQGVLSKPMNDRRSAAVAYQVADLVLRGARHPAVQDAQFFHTAGWHFPYTNMH